MSDPGLSRGGALLPPDGWLLYLCRFLRLFAYGLLSVVLVLYLDALGLGAGAIGALLTLTLLGDTLISLFLTTRADRFGRRRVLVAGAGLMIFAALLLGSSDSLLVLTLAATIGVISPSGNEVGPFLPVEQAALSQFIPADQRTRYFAWYNLVGAGGTGLGALCGGSLVSWAGAQGYAGAAAYYPVLAAYGVAGLLLGLCAGGLSPAVELRDAKPGLAGGPRPAFGLHQSRGVVARLSALFALDAFGGGLVIQSVLAYWLVVRFQVSAADLGALFLGVNVLAGLSYLGAGWLARRIGLLNTMVFTHLPANMLLAALPFMPNFASAVGLLLARALVTQMDVPTRQAYLMAVVLPDERAAAGGVTAVARSVGAALAPPVTMLMSGSAAFLGVPMVVAGVLKIGYDLMLYRGFSHLKPEHERGESRGPV